VATGKVTDGPAGRYRRDAQNRMQCNIKYSGNTIVTIYISTIHTEATASMGGDCTPGHRQVVTYGHLPRPDTVAG
jgi:hypothetical protein